MAQSNISVETKTIASLLEDFKKEMINLDTLLNKVSSETEKMKAYWEGKASDDTLTRISGYKKIFDSIREQNIKYAEFVDSVMEKYTDADKDEKDFVESHITSFETDYYGNQSN